MSSLSFVRSFGKSRIGKNVPPLAVDDPRVEGKQPTGEGIKEGSFLPHNFFSVFPPSSITTPLTKSSQTQNLDHGSLTLTSKTTTIYQRLYHFFCSFPSSRCSSSHSSPSSRALLLSPALLLLPSSARSSTTTRTMAPTSSTAMASPTCCSTTARATST